MLSEPVFVFLCLSSGMQHYIRHRLRALTLAVKRKGKRRVSLFCVSLWRLVPHKIHTKGAFFSLKPVALISLHAATSEIRLHFFTCMAMFNCSSFCDLAKLLSFRLMMRNVTFLFFECLNRSNSFHAESKVNKANCARWFSRSFHIAFNIVI